MKKRAPRALKAIKKFAQIHMGTSDVRIENGLNKYMWSRGITQIPNRVRVRCSRLRNDATDDAAPALYTVVSHVPVETFKELTPTTVEEELD
jgi:large subunit ribosomal protein L31e